LLDILSTLVGHFGRVLNLVDSDKQARALAKATVKSQISDDIDPSTTAFHGDFSVSTDRIHQQLDDFRHSFDKTQLSLRTELARLKTANSTVDSTLKTFSFKPTLPMNGIISHLNGECGGNVVEKGVIRVTSSSQCDDTRIYDERKIVDMNPDTCYHSTQDGGDQWISYDFRTMRITPTKYSILTRSDFGPDVCQPKSWVIETSRDGKPDGIWNPVDERRDNNELNGRSFCAQFDIAKPEETRFIRLRQLASHYRDNCLVIAGLEFFGTLRQ
jgi:hypothetical protein